MVDAAARAVARDAFRGRPEPYREVITVAVSWQCAHLFRTENALKMRSDLDMLNELCDITS